MKIVNKIKKMIDGRRRIKDKISKVCEMSFGDMKSITEISKETGMSLNSISEILSDTMFFKKYDEFTHDENIVITIQSKV